MTEEIENKSEQPDQPESQSEFVSSESSSTESSSTQSTSTESTTAVASATESIDAPLAPAEDAGVIGAEADVSDASSSAAPAIKRNEPRERRPRNEKSDKSRADNPRGEKGRSRRGEAGKNGRGKAQTDRIRPPQMRAFNRFVVVTWSGQREPADTMFWAEAERQGDWVVFKSLDQIRTRREVLDRLAELDAGLVGFDFHFSYPKPFFEQLGTVASDWRTLTKKVREELKKNSDDGVRLWIERMGKYRESQLESEEDAQMWRDRRNDRRNDWRANDRRDQRGSNDRFMRDRRPEPIPATEKRSMAERFRRTDLPLRRFIEQYIAPLQIAYNKLTSRYEFSDPAARGRASLQGMSMFDQALELKPELSVWPFAKPAKLTAVEIQPALFTQGKTKPADEIRRMISVYEDSGWDIPSHIRDLAARNPDAQRAFLSVIGMIRTENREERMNRPLRDFQDIFYTDPQVQLEGWIYGVGYRHPDQPKREDAQASTKGDKREGKGKSREAKVERPSDEVVGAPAVTENPIIQESSAEQLSEEASVSTPVSISAVEEPVELETALDESTRTNS